MRGVTPDAAAKTHFVLIDCVGVTESKMQDTQPLDKKPSVSLKKILEHVALGGTDPDLLSSLVSRLTRLDKQCGPDERQRIAAVSGGVQIRDITHQLAEALDPDVQQEIARQKFELPAEVEPSAQQVEAVAKERVREATQPLASAPKLRKLIVELKHHLRRDESSQARDGPGLAGGGVPHALGQGDDDEAHDQHGKQGQPPTARLLREPAHIATRDDREKQLAPKQGRQPPGVRDGPRGEEDLYEPPTDPQPARGHPEAGAPGGASAPEQDQSQPVGDGKDGDPGETYRIKADEEGQRAESGDTEAVGEAKAIEYRAS